MSLNKYFFYDKSNSNFIPVEYNTLERVIYSASIWIIGGVVLCGLAVGIFSKSVGSPAEVALRAENKELLKQLTHTQKTIKSYQKDLKTLASNDNKLYRSILGMKPIAYDEREGGSGGADIYSNFDVYGKKTSTILKWTAKNLENMQHTIAIQKFSFKKIKKRYNTNKTKFAHIPAIRPTQGTVISGFGMRFHPILKYRRMHNGLDFTASVGSNVYATGAGTVKIASRHGTFGNLVVIDHGFGYETYYAHLSAFAKDIRPGAVVKRGDKIALSGETGRATGPHLHYEVHKDGKPVDPINYLFANTSPSQYLKFKRIAESSTKSMD